MLSSWISRDSAGCPRIGWSPGVWLDLQRCGWMSRASSGDQAESSRNSGDSVGSSEIRLDLQRCGWISRDPVGYPEVRLDLQRSSWISRGPLGSPKVGWISRDSAGAPEIRLDPQRSGMDFKKIIVVYSSSTLFGDPLLWLSEPER